MTGFLHEKEFSRKKFLGGGGALIVGFSVAGNATAATQQLYARPKQQVKRLNDPSRHADAAGNRGQRRSGANL